MIDTVRVRPNDVATGEQELYFKRLVIKPGSRTVVKDGREKHLTATEFDLLYFLASHPGQVFTREELMRLVWDYSIPMDCSTVTVHIRRLREKVEGYPSRPAYIKTVWGVGYKFETLEVLSL